MSLIEHRLDCKINKVKTAIERVKLAAELSPEPLYVCYSGGKDSKVLRRIMELSGVAHELHYNHTSVDIPDLVREIKNDPSIIIDIPRYADGRQKTMWNLIVKKHMPPTRLMRYCCAELKEIGGIGRICVTGCRWAESTARAGNQGEVTIFNKRKIPQVENAEYRETRRGGIVMNLDNDANRRMIEMCYRTNKTLVNPLIDWTDEDIWEFSRAENIRQSDWYKVFARLGCIGCPMAGREGQLKEFREFPKYKGLYIAAFDRMLKNMNHTTTWKSGEQVFDWWLDDKKSDMPIKGQVTMWEEVSKTDYETAIAEIKEKGDKK